MKKISLIIALISVVLIQKSAAQWNTSGNNIYNSNSGYVGIGTNSPSYLLHVGKNMTEPNIAVQNFGGTGGATFTMIDNASGANWKFKATLSGGFKIRDHANGLDVIVIEPGSFANAIYIKNTDNIGIGTSTPAGSAALDISSTDKGLLVPRLSIIQIQAIANPENGLQVFCTTDSKMYIFVAPDNQWKEVAFGSGTISPPPPGWTCGDSIFINHITGTVAPVNKNTSYGTVTNIPGELTKCWISSNLGSDHQATSVTDPTEASAGWYWQFNRPQGYKHDGSNITPGWTITSINESSEWIPGNDPCNIELGAGWRLPTITELNNIDVTGNWTNWNGPWNSALKLHAAGDLDYTDGLLYNRGSDGLYWSNSQATDTEGWRMHLSSISCYTNAMNKAIGFSVRCIHE